MRPDLNTCKVGTWGGSESNIEHIQGKCKAGVPPSIWGWPSPMAGVNLGENNPPTGFLGRARMNELMTYEFSDRRVRGSSYKNGTLRGKVNLAT